MSAYLFRLVKNRCLDYLKHKAFEQKYVEHIQSSFEIELSLKLQSLDRFDICNISEGNETEVLITFEYSDIKLSADKIQDTDTVTVSFKVKNTGDRDGAEVAQLYVSEIGRAHV